MSYLSTLLQATGSIVSSLLKFENIAPHHARGGNEWSFLAGGEQRLMAYLHQGVRSCSSSEINSWVDIIFGLKMTFFPPQNSYSCLGKIGNDAFFLDKVVSPAVWPTPQRGSLQGACSWWLWLGQTLACASALPHGSRPNLPLLDPKSSP